MRRLKLFACKVQPRSRCTDQSGMNGEFRKRGRPSCSQPPRHFETLQGSVWRSQTKAMLDRGTLYSRPAKCHRLLSWAAVFALALVAPGISQVAAGGGGQPRPE
jgi:hypothetical protein